ncbi:MAG: response regulator, partial [Bacteroidota bacterium]
SRFSLLFPAEGADETAAPPTVPAPLAKPCTVLVIDDERLVRAHVGRALSSYGYAVREAEDGHSGLASIQASPPDVVILDMSMPDLDGGEVLRRLRATGSRVPVVLSSGYVDAAQREGLASGMFQRVLDKPYSIAELIEAVEAARAAEAIA